MQPSDRPQQRGEFQRARARRRAAGKLNQTAQRVEGHERALRELEQRLRTVEARAAEAEGRARAAEDRARAAEDRARAAEERAQAAERPPAVPQAPPEPSAAPPVTVPEPPDEAISVFPDLAREVEARVEAIEERVARASDAVQELAAPGALAEPAAPPIAEPELEPEAEEPRAGRLDINRISFEQLRELGLTVTQAARLLASRDARGRFRSLDELNELWGFSRELIEKLMRRLSVGG